jgi:hypothetical protein
MPDQAVVKHQGEAKAFRMLGGLYEINRASDETGGGLSVIETTRAAGIGLPPEVDDRAEVVYALEGRVRYGVARRHGLEIRTPAPAR